MARGRPIRLDFVSGTRKRGPTLQSYAQERLHISFDPRSAPVSLDAETRATIDAAARLMQAHALYLKDEPALLRAIVRGILQGAIAHTEHALSHPLAKDNTNT